MGAISMHRWLLGMIISVVLVSCEKDEIPVKPYDRGDVEELQVELGSNYENQVWIDLENMTVVSTNARHDWDIAFDCSDSANWIYLNAAVGMMAAPSGSSDFESEIEISELNFRPDHASGDLDSLSLAYWWQSDEVWVIDMGYKLDGTSRGRRKIQFNLEEDGSLGFKYATLNGNNLSEGSIAKNDRYNKSAYSLIEHQQIQIEPEKDAYDLVFTQYMHLFYNPYYPYLVTGALLNPNTTRAVYARGAKFEEVSSENFMDYPLTDSLDAIGYDWKYYSLETSAYTVFSDQTYIVQDQHGFYYKLHFVDFYNEQAEKGYPKMEIQRL